MKENKTYKPTFLFSFLDLEQKKTKTKQTPGEEKKNLQTTTATLNQNTLILSIKMQT